VVYTNNHSSVVTAEAIGNAKTASATPESNVLSFRVVFMPEGAPVEGVPVEVVVNGKVTQRLETTEGGNISLNAPIGSVVRFTVIDKTKEVKVTNDLLANAANRTITIGFGDTDQTIISEGETFMAEGTVYDNDEEKPTPVIGAVVKNVRTQKGVVTDKEGRFSIEATAGDQVVVSYAGYEPFAMGVSKAFSDDGSKYIVPLRHVNTGKTFDVVEEMPQFPGGPSALFEFLSKNIQYPKDAEKANLQGRVIVTFVVKKDGSIADAKVVKSVAPSLDAEALRVINAMPNWAPGRQGGKPVNVKYTVPLTFRVEGGIKGADNPLVQKTTSYLAGYYAGKNGLPPTPKTLILVDGKEVSYDELDKIKGESIDHMDVLKGESATKLYGEKAKHGAVLIFTKKNQ